MKFGKLIATGNFDGWKSGAVVKAYRYDERELTQGETLEHSRTIIDDEIFEDLPGTCCLLKSFDKGQYYGKRYVVKGEFAGFGEDDGEILLTNCTVC